MDCLERRHKDRREDEHVCVVHNELESLQCQQQEIIDTQQNVVNRQQELLGTHAQLLQEHQDRLNVGNGVMFTLAAVGLAFIGLMVGIAIFTVNSLNKNQDDLVKGLRDSQSQHEKVVNSQMMSLEQKQEIWSRTIIRNQDDIREMQRDVKQEINNLKNIQGRIFSRLKSELYADNGASMSDDDFFKHHGVLR